MRISGLKLGLPKPDRKKAKAKRDRETKQKLIELHETIRDLAYESASDRYRCFHCRRLFERDEIYADHWPETKGHNPKIKFDPDACVPSCAICNTDPNRRTPPPYGNR